MSPIQSLAWAMLYRFAQCELDLRRHLFRRDGKLVALEPQVFDLLALFVVRAGDLIDRDEMLATVWDGRIVSEAAISSRISAVRRAIGDSGKAQGMLKTVPRRGFRFLVAVEAEPVQIAPGKAVAASRSEEPHEQDIRLARSTDGICIAFASTGSGSPLMRAGHFLTHLERDWESPVWRPLLDRLGASFRVTRYDQRGTGMSDHAPDQLSLDALVDDLEAVADAAGLDRFPIFAASQGVPVAIAFAVRCPARVSGLVLYGGYAQGRSVRGTLEETRNADAILTIIRQGWGRAGSAFATAFASIYMPDATSEQLHDMADMQLASASPANAVALRIAIDAFDVQHLLPAVQAPTLVLHASEDSVHPVSQARVVAAGIPGARIHVMTGRNHIPLPQDPCWLNLLDRAEQFLRRL